MAPQAALLISTRKMRFLLLCTTPHFYTQVSVLVFWSWPIVAPKTALLISTRKIEILAGWGLGAAAGLSAGALTRLLGMVFGPN